MPGALGRAVTTQALERSAVRNAVTSVDLRARYGLFIAGEWVAPESGAVAASVNPATETPLAEVSRAGPLDVDRAVRAARRAYDKYWRKLRGADRAKYVYRIAQAVTERSRDLATCESLDSGKPLAQTRDGDVPAAAADFFYHAGWADKLDWAVAQGQRARPLGVVGAICSWTSPLLEAVQKLAPALACGNTVVIKPDEHTPLSTLLLAAIAVEAGLPPGVVNVVTGSANAAEALAEHPGVDRLAFSGPTDVGKALRRAAAGTAKRITLELGGKPPIIVFEDAPLDRALDAIVRGAFRSRGPGAVGGSRLLVHESLVAQVIERLRVHVERLRVGDPLDEETDIGPLASRAARDRFVDYVRAGVEEGAVLAAHGTTAPEQAYFVAPALFGGVEASYRIARDEVFGPVLCTSAFRTTEEAIERANALPEGPWASLWTASGALALRAASQLSAGTVWCNGAGAIDPSAPRGGFGTSGLGRAGGLAGVREYVQT